VQQIAFLQVLKVVSTFEFGTKSNSVDKTLEEPLKNHTTQVGPMGQRGLGGTRKAFMS
jgi:hypothetical protein